MPNVYPSVLPEHLSLPVCRKTAKNPQKKQQKNPTKLLTPPNNKRTPPNKNLLSLLFKARLSVVSEGRLVVRN